MRTNRRPVLTLEADTELTAEEASWYSRFVTQGFRLTILDPEPAAPARPEASTDVPAWDGNHLLVSRGGPMTYRVATEADLRAAGYVRLTRRTRPEIGLEPESEPPGNTGMRPDATDAVIAERNRVCTCPRSGPKSPSVGMIRRPAIIIGHQPRCPALDVLARAAR